MKKHLLNFLRAGLFFAVLASALPSHAQQIPTVGAACSTGQTTFWEQGAICTSGTWQRPAFQFGAATGSCASGTAGMVQWTGTKLQYCNGTAWTDFADASGGSWTSTSYTSGTNTWVWADHGSPSEVLVLAVGGGGGGGYTSGGVYASNGAGGGGGGEVVYVRMPVAGNLTVTVGAGGTGGLGPSTAGTAGGNTTITQSGLFNSVTALGGSPGASAGYSGGSGGGNVDRHNGLACDQSNGCRGATGGTGSTGTSVSGVAGSSLTNALVWMSLGSGGSGGNYSGGNGGGGGGGASRGNGGNGGNAGAVGSSAAANSGGGGGGGGNNGSGTLQSGNGGSGYVAIYSLE